MTLTLKLPPWGVPCEMEIKVCDSVSFDTLKRTISAIEENRLGSDNAGAAKEEAACPSTPPTTPAAFDDSDATLTQPDDINASAASVSGTNALLVVLWLTCLQCAVLPFSLLHD